MHLSKGHYSTTGFLRRQTKSGWIPWINQVSTLNVLINCKIHFTSPSNDNSNCITKLYDLAWKLTKPECMAACIKHTIASPRAIQLPYLIPLTRNWNMVQIIKTSSKMTVINSYLIMVCPCTTCSATLSALPLFHFPWDFLLDGHKVWTSQWTCSDSQVSRIAPRVCTSCRELPRVCGP